MTETSAQLAVAVIDQHNAKTTSTAFGLSGVITAKGLDLLTDNDLDRRCCRARASAKISWIEALTAASMVADMIAQRYTAPPIISDHQPQRKGHEARHESLQLRRARVIAAIREGDSTSKQIGQRIGMTSGGVVHILDRMICSGDVEVRKYREVNSQCAARNHYSLSDACLGAVDAHPATCAAPSIGGYVAARVGAMRDAGTSP